MFFQPAYGLLVRPEDVEVADLRGGVPPASVPTLKDAMDIARPGKGRLAIVVSDAHCRYLVMSRPRGLRHRKELMAAMRQRFEATFGDSRRWMLRHHASPLAHLDLVVGMDAELLQRIDAQARAAGVTVASIRPHWTAWASHFQRETRRGDHWVIAGDHAWASIGHIRHGQCHFAQTVRLQEGHDSVADLLARAWAHVDMPEGSAAVWVGGAALPQGDTFEIAGCGSVIFAQSHALWGGRREAA
jgi:hypothetical protein